MPITEEALNNSPEYLKLISPFNMNKNEKEKDALKRDRELTELIDYIMKRNLERVKEVSIKVTDDIKKTSIQGTTGKFS